MHGNQRFLQDFNKDFEPLSWVSDVRIVSRTPKPVFFKLKKAGFWYARRESNSQQCLRRARLYPFNYGHIFSFLQDIAIPTLANFFRRGHQIGHQILFQPSAVSLKRIILSGFRIVLPRFDGFILGIAHPQEGFADISI